MYFKKLLIVFVVAVFAIGYGREFLGSNGAFTASDNSVVAIAYAQHQSNVQVSGSGKVTRILSDDDSGSRHQKFILRMSSGQTVLIAHNIDLAPRLDNLGVGDVVEFNGEYEWNAKGGVIHWTHRDPRGRHPDGWLKRSGSVYQ